MKYKLVENAYPESLESEVNNLIKQGWKPLSGVSVSRDRYGSNNEKIYVQAMIQD